MIISNAFVYDSLNLLCIKNLYYKNVLITFYKFNKNVNMPLITIEHATQKILILVFLSSINNLV